MAKTEPGPGDLHDVLRFTPATFLTVDDDPDQTMQVFSSEDGRTYWVMTEVAGEAELKQGQRFVKDRDDARFELVISGALLEAFDANGLPQPQECPAGPEQCPLVQTVLSFTAQAFRDTEGNLLLGADGGIALDASSSVSLAGAQQAWQEPFVGRNGAHIHQAWTRADFDATSDARGDGFQMIARVALREPIHLDVDLSGLDVGDEFQVDVHLRAIAIPRRGESEAVAFLRDPTSATGTAMSYDGVTPVETTALVTPAPLPPEPCAGGTDPAVGALGFASEIFSLLEGQAGLDEHAVQIVRTFGSSGPITATLEVGGGGTAVPGVDYTPIRTTIRFEDGDTEPRYIPIDLSDDAEAGPAVTVDLSLSEPGGCGLLDRQSKARLDILDDDSPAVLPEGFTYGGVVQGLVPGNHVVLDDSHGFLERVEADGPFAFDDLDWPAGTAYQVGIFNQPFDPFQECVVANGQGVLTDHDVTDIVVTCPDP